MYQLFQPAWSRWAYGVDECWLLMCKMLLSRSGFMQAHALRIHVRHATSTGCMVLTDEAGRCTGEQRQVMVGLPRKNVVYSWLEVGECGMSLGLKLVYSDLKLMNTVCACRGLNELEGVIMRYEHVL